MVNYNDEFTEVNSSSYVATVLKINKVEINLRFGVSRNTQGTNIVIINKKLKYK